jgi:hypothetical protein
MGVVSALAGECCAWPLRRRQPRSRLRPRSLRVGTAAGVLDPSAVHPRTRSRNWDGKW